MKNKDEQTGLVGLVGLAIGAAVIGLVSAQKTINRASIIDELMRLGDRRAMVFSLRCLRRQQSWLAKGDKIPAQWPGYILKYFKAREPLEKFI